MVQAKDSIMKNRQLKSSVPTHVLRRARVAVGEAEKIASGAEKVARLAKARFKVAKRAFKVAKKAAKRAAKAAKRRRDELEALLARRVKPGKAQTRLKAQKAKLQSKKTARRNTPARKVPPRARKQKLKPRPTLTSNVVPNAAPTIPVSPPASSEGVSITPQNPEQTS